MREALGLVVFVLAVTAVAAFGATFAPGAWYESLAKPAWNPPNWIFGPVWTLLYVLVAISGWLVWRQRGRQLAPALIWFVLQLLLNAAWSWLFFGLQRIDLALVDILLLWLAIAITIRHFRPRSQLAAYLLAPYLLWVTFATALNAAIWWLN